MLCLSKLCCLAEHSITVLYCSDRWVWNENRLAIDTALNAKKCLSKCSVNWWTNEESLGPWNYEMNTHTHTLVCSWFCSLGTSGGLFLLCPFLMLWALIKLAHALVKEQFVIWTAQEPNNPLMPFPLLKRPKVARWNKRCVWITLGGHFLWS